MGSQGRQGLGTDHVISAWRRDPSLVRRYDVPLTALSRFPLPPTRFQSRRYHIEQKAQKFIPGSPDSEGISSLAVSANRKYLAVAEKAEKAMITVFDLHTLKRRKVLTTTDVGSKVRGWSVAHLSCASRVTPRATTEPRRYRIGKEG